MSGPDNAAPFTQNQVDETWKRKAPPTWAKNKKLKTDTSVPKNPLEHLNDLKPGLKFNFNIDPYVQPLVFVASIEVDNKKYIGKGLSKKAAKLVVALTLLKELGFEYETTETTDKIESDFGSDHPSNHPVSRLNQIFPGINFELVRENITLPSERYTMSVTVNGKTYEGSGKTKKLAKVAAAREALSDILKSNIDIKSLKESRKSPKKLKTNGNVESSKEKDFAEMPPTMILNQINPFVKYEFVKEDYFIPGQRFTMSVLVNDKIFEGSGATKKAAKTAAARAALCDMFHINYSSEGMDESIKESFNQKFPQRVADKIAQAVFAKYQEIVSSKYINRWKVLAGIALTSDAEMDDITVIALATGIGSIQGQYMSSTGETINDPHAEVLVRRCFKSYLFSQLELLTNHSTQDQSIFTKAEKGGFCLKPHIKFHLFITTSPCGGAKILAPGKESNTSSANEKQGTLQIKTGILTTAPLTKIDLDKCFSEIAEGKRRLLNMSCSDKIASWNVIGLQGALLGHFIFPVYLDTIILGNYFDPHRMMNVMWGRFENIAPDLVPPFRLNKPNICCTTSIVARNESRHPQIAINWIPDLKDNFEEIYIHTGKNKSGEASHICKKALFAKFLRLCTWLPGIVDDPNLPKLYADMKGQVKDYQCAKERFKKSFEENGLGSWIKKPFKQNNFELSLTDIKNP